MAAKNSSPPDIDDAMEETLSLVNLRDLLTDTADSALQLSMDAAVFDHFPVLKTLNSIGQFGLDIRQALFAKRVFAFLFELSETSTKQRQAFVTKYTNDKGRKRLGETIISLLERAESIEKARRMGIITAAAIEGFLPTDKAVRLCAMVDRAYLEDLDKLPTFLRPKTTTSTEAESLKAVGFLTTQGYNTEGTRDYSTISQLRYLLSEYGKLYLKVTHGDRSKSR
ncbi:hypothetical protein ATO7_06260 [Oceanococcus atlanticus]|uniref:Uncharacterized protein n=1 Tax=Oceanococcus atlanticus TaxID=1317117 RepID=A0A1Y1SJJ9_9GAMM|nr:hypothetical protein [Oceanococcus atlanticus]ORE89461.1 hypothetical protein ATO7_06260 [Oceanococcus atlanticus]